MLWLKRALPAFFIVLFALSAGARELLPRQVAKNGEIEIPEGMHLVRDRAGLRWLLPLEMQTPPEREVALKYFKAARKPREIGRIGSHVILDGPISALDAVISTTAEDRQGFLKRINFRFADLLRLEKQANLHARNSNDLKSLGAFGPAEMTTFQVPYIPIPEDEMEFAEISDYARPATKALLRFEANGKKYFRYFIHPNHADAYADLIAKFGIVYHYQGMATSSPRSLVLIDPERIDRNRDLIHWAKVSLHRMLDGSVRINTDKKARRAIIMSEAIHEVPKEALDSYHVSFMLEPAAFQPKGKLASTIHREIPEDLLHPASDEVWIPAFILQNTGEDAVPGMNIHDMAIAAGESYTDFIRERVVRPLLYAYLNMGLKEGLPGELHTQNFYYKLKRVRGGWTPTGDVKFKDNDGFRYDTELALRQGRGMKSFARFDDPFTWGKFSNAIGTGAEGIPFLGSWYYKLIRNVNGFETLAAYMLRVLAALDPASPMDKNGMQAMFDQIAAEEAERITGIHLDKEEYGFGKDKGLNRVLNERRAKLSGEEDTRQRQDAALQTLLAGEWNRLREAQRVSPLRRSLPQDAYYILHEQPDGAHLIEARTPRVTMKNPDPTVGFALVESDELAGGKLANRRLRKALANFRRTLPAAGGYRCVEIFKVNGI